MSKASSKVISYVFQLQGGVFMTVFWFAVVFVDDATVEQRISVVALMVLALLSFAVAIYANKDASQ